MINYYSYVQHNTCTKLVHIDGRQVLYSMTADHQGEISFALFLLVVIICSFHHLYRQDQLMFEDQAPYVSITSAERSTSNKL